MNNLLNKFFLKLKKTTLIQETKAINTTNYERLSYSQDGEDIVLASFFEETPDYKGFYIDLGALHPFRYSNTQYFYNRGWRGLNVDATPGSMDKFNQFRQGDINVEIAISSKNSKLTFYSFEEPALNSFNKKLSVKRINKGWKLIEKKFIKTIPINTLLTKYLQKGQKIDFMSIDIEGLETEVLNTLNWEKFKPDFLLIEELTVVDKDVFIFKKNDLYKLLTKHGYCIVAKTRRTLIFKKIN